jgi:hypothetical protein
MKVSVECLASNEMGELSLADQLLVFIDPLDPFLAPKQHPHNQEQRLAPITRDVSGLMYFGPGIHDVGERLIVPQNTHVRIDGGAYVRGSLFTSSSSSAKSNITISGGGVLSGELIPHPTSANDSLALINLCADDATVKGITVVNPPTYMVQVLTHYTGTRTLYSHTILTHYAHTLCAHTILTHYTAG